MNTYCQDRDLLCIEPVVFIGGGFASQELAAGSGAAVSGATFTAGGADFHAAGVVAGMVLCVYQDAASEGRACEIIAAPSPTTLTVSVLRSDRSAAPVAPPAQSGLSYRIRTYGPQVAAVSAALGEKLRRLGEAAAVAAADFADSEQLRLAAAYGTLADVFVARAANAEAQDANWTKAEHYRQLFQSLQLQLRLAVDADGDGFAEQTRTLGNVQLRRS